MKAHVKWFGALVLGLSLAACGGTAATSSTGGGGGTPGGGTGNGGGGSVIPAALQGDWRAGEAAPVGYYDPNSGAWQGATGTSFILKLRGDGSYEYTALMAVDTGSCRSKILSVEKGRVTLDGNKMTLTPSEGDVQSYVCSSTIKHAPVTPSAKRWALSVDDYGKEVLFTNTLDNSLKNDAFYRMDRPGKTYPLIGIQGSVSAPEGRDVKGTLVVACYKDDPACLSPARKIQKVTGSGASGTFNFPALDDKPYFLQAVQDTNQNGAIDSGDLVDVYSTTDAPGPVPAVQPPASNVKIELVEVK